MGEMADHKALSRNFGAKEPSNGLMSEQVRVAIEHYIWGHSNPSDEGLYNFIDEVEASGNQTTPDDDEHPF